MKHISHYAGAPLLFIIPRVQAGFLSTLIGGISTTVYNLLSRELRMISGVPVVFINVTLRCNTEEYICNGA